MIVKFSRNKISIFVSNGRGLYLMNGWAQEYFDSKIDHSNTGFVGFDLSRLVPLQPTTKSFLFPGRKCAPTCI